MNSLFDVLIGWRQNEVAFAGDVSKMYNQIAVHPDDQKYHRFLWRDGETDREPDVYQWVRFSFGDKPAPDLAINAINEGPEGGGPIPISDLKFWQNPSPSWIFIRNPSPSY